MENYKEYLEDFIEILRAEPKDNPNAFMELSANSQKELANAIENLLSDLYMANDIINEQIDLLKGSISKYEIEQKIEKLEDIETELSDEQGYWGGSSLLIQIDTLKSLLEGD